MYLAQKINLKINSNIYIYSFTIYFIYLFSNVLANSIYGLPSITTFFLNIVRSFVYLTFLLGLVFLFLNTHKKEFIYIGGLILIFLFNYLCYSNIPERYSSYLNTFVFICFPLSMFAFNLDGNKLINALERVGYIASIIYVVLFLGILTGRLHLNTYDTALSYVAILPESIVICRINSKNGFHRIISILSLIPYIIFVLLFGSRGPIVVIIFICSYVLLNIEYKAKSIKKFFIVVLFSVLLLVFIIFFSDILNVVLKLTDRLGINSRTLQLISSDFTHSSGRNEIYSTIFKEIIEHPFRIRGIASDTDIIMGNQYVHNLFLELLYQFGILFGGTACLSIIILFIKSVNFKTYEKDSIETICAIIAFVQLMFSSSLWLNFIFWVWFTRAISSNERKIQL